MEILLTITALQHHIESEDLNPNQEVILKKEPSNKFDTEAIAVYINETKQIGYIANSTHTKAKGTYSAGRLYDKIPNESKAKILVVFHHSAIALIQLEK